MRALLLPAALGLLTGLAIPHAALLRASSELIAFVSLLMAGLLPAMTLTATVLRGDAFSAARVRDYGARLHQQLRFWGGLFAAAATAVLLITAAKMLGDPPATRLVVGRVALSMPWNAISQAVCGLAAAAFFVMLSRLWPAYRGLTSLLALTVRMAEAQALTNDRGMSDALAEKIERVSSATQKPRRAEWPTE